MNIATQPDQSLEAELNNAKLAIESPLSDDTLQLNKDDNEIEQMEIMQGMLQGEIAAMQALIDQIDPSERDEYQSIISQLQSGNVILGAAIAKPTSRNINSARGVMKHNAYNVAATELAILSDDKHQNPQDLTPYSQSNPDNLSDAAFHILQTSQVNMERKINADEAIFQHADVILSQYGSAKLDDALLDEMMIMNALQALPYEHRKVISTISNGDSSPARLNKMIDGFVSGGLVSVECLNNACEAIADERIKDDGYARQIVAVASMVTALQVGKILVAEYMELEIRKQRSKSVANGGSDDFHPQTIISDIQPQGQLAKPPLLAEQWILQKPSGSY